jgi:hypothetical protein
MAKRDLADFARAVINLHDHKIFDEPLNKRLFTKPTKRWGDVYQVAIGLSTLRTLADRELKRLRKKPRGLLSLRESGLRQAIALLDALATGKRHPIYDHIAGVQSGAFRPLRTKPNTIEEMDFNGLLAIVRALKAAGVRRQSVAIRQTIKACNLNGRCGAKLERQIRDFNRRSRDGTPDQLASVIVQSSKEGKSGTVVERIEQIAALWAAQTFALPDPP